MASTSVTPPRLACACGQAIDIPGVRVGEAVTCPACKATRVVIRSRVTGEVPPAARTGGLTADERAEVKDALKRIKLRRAGAASAHVELYPSWAVFVAGVQFYLSAFLAGQNLVAMGEARRGRQLQAVGVVCYVIVVAALLVARFKLGLPKPALIGLVATVPLLFSVWFTVAQHEQAAVAREHGARNASLLLPALVGVILAVAQAFAVNFLWLSIERGAW